MAFLNEQGLATLWGKIDDKFARSNHTHTWSEINNKPFISDASDTLTWDGDTNGLLCPNGILYKVSDLVVTLDDLSNGCLIEYAMNDSTVDPIEPIVLTSDECQDRYSLDDNWIHLESVVCVLVDNSDSLLPEAGIYFLNDEISRVKSFTIPGYEGFITEKLNINALPEHTHEISDITNLQSELDNKALASDVNSLENMVSNKLVNLDNYYLTVSSHVNDQSIHVLPSNREDWDTAYTHSQTAHAPSNAEKNQNAFSNVAIGSTTITADSATDTLSIVAGGNVTITPDANNDKITISATDTTYTFATGDNSGQIAVTPSGGTKQNVLVKDFVKIITHNSTTSLPEVVNGAILIAYDE